MSVCDEVQIIKRNYYEVRILLENRQYRVGWDELKILPLLRLKNIEMGSKEYFEKVMQDFTDFTQA